MPISEFYYPIFLSDILSRHTSYFKVFSGIFLSSLDVYKNNLDMTYSGYELLKFETFALWNQAAVGRAGMAHRS